jgi:hypothetical protein
VISNKLLGDSNPVVANIVAALMEINETPHVALKINSQNISKMLCGSVLFEQNVKKLKESVCERVVQDCVKIINSATKIILKMMRVYYTLFVKGFFLFFLFILVFIWILP